jgi:drug/metabolite transporter (DMT)-like permease
LAIGFGLLALFAAFLHAGWNALVKTASDRLLTLSAVALMQFVAGAFMIPFVSPPAPASWLLIGLSALFHYFYYPFLYYAYRFGDLSQVYPLARGLAPVLVAAGAAIFAREILPPLSLLGIILASLGIASIAFFHETSLKRNPAGLVFAAGTGMIIAAYTVADGLGVRLSGSPLGYIAWLFILEFPVVLFAVYRRRNQLMIFWRREWMSFIGTGLCAVVAYGIVIYAVAYAPMAAISALRETGVIMAALIGAFVLGERSWKQRVMAAVLVAAGIAVITEFS